MTFSPSNSLGAFVPINQTFSEDQSQFLIQITNRDRDIARYINAREIAIYDLIEILTGEQWFGATPQVKRDVFRRVYQLGATAAGATTTIAHGITGLTAFTHIYGTAVTAVVDYRPIPYSSVTAVTDQIEINVDATNINVSNGATAPNITSGIIVLEYLKN
jgi:hypothetical protein